MKLNFYCAMRSYNGRGLNLKAADGEKIIFIHSGELYAAVSYTKYSKFSETMKLKKSHETVIKTIGAKTNVLPFRFNTIVGESIGRGILVKHHDAILPLIDNLGKCCEFIVYADRDRSGNMMNFRNLMQAGSNEKRPYNKITDIAGHKLAGRIHNNFSQLAKQSRLERLTSDDRLVEGYYLVDEKKSNEIKQAFNWVESLYPELELTLIGPQPPYSFNAVKIQSSRAPLQGGIFNG